MSPIKEQDKSLLNRIRSQSKLIQEKRSELKALGVKELCIKNIAQSLIK